MMLSLIVLASLSVSAAGDGMTLGPFELTGRGYVQNDLRVVVARPNGSGERQGEFIRNEASVFGRLHIGIGEHVTGAISARPVFTGIAKVSKFNDLLDRAQLDPFWLELDDAFVEIAELLPGLDLRLGRQAIVWGTGDMFNPTNNLNARDFYDPLTFGKPISNQMIQLKYQAPFPVQLTAVYVPVFRPGRLPTTAPAAFTGPVPVASRTDQRAIAELDDFQRSFTVFGPIRNTIELVPELPTPTLGNGMAAAKVSGTLFDIDLSLSYLYGRWDLPVATRVTPVTTFNQGADGALGGGDDSVDTQTKVKLIYPRMHVIGADASYSVEPLGGLGLWVEVAVTVPEKVDLAINHPDILNSFYKNPPCHAGNAALGTAASPCPVVRAQPFVKATAGLDYTIGKWVYVNAQYLYGFVDEFGIDYLKHYAVATVDLRPFGEAYVLRLAGVINLNDASHVAFPAFILKAWEGVELNLGALIFGASKPAHKFGSPAVGNTQVFLKGRLSF